MNGNSKSVPTCGTCEKILIEKMMEKYKLFRIAYYIMKKIISIWMWFVLTKEEFVEEDNAVRKCRTCDKIYLRRFKAKSPLFAKVYNLMDATVEGWIDKFLTEEEKNQAYDKDPIHKAELARFNPNQYYVGQDPIVCIKFDCIAEENPNNFSEIIGPIDGVKEKLQDFMGAGIKIVVYGWRSNECRNGNKQYRKQAEVWLKKNGVPYNFFYDGRMPLIGDVFISKRVKSNSVADAYDEVMALKPGDYTASRHNVEWLEK